MNTETSQALAGAREFSVRLPSTPRGARLARHAAVRQLRAWGRPSDAVELVVAELVSNAVRHGHVPGRGFRLVLRVSGRGVLRIEVSDTRGECLPRSPGPVEPDAESGRGLLLVAALADRWGTESGPEPRKTVWAEMGPPGGTG
ncbi:ATP-binding protein [Streptomyces longispororuber]|uniref:ATP-binding protein n=1 Tax=Streptomyces longispororuber TaxID=68230 RepID=UPI00370197DC